MNRSTLWGLLLYPVAAVQTHMLFHPAKTSEFFFWRSEAQIREGRVALSSDQEARSQVRTPDDGPVCVSVAPTAAGVPFLRSVTYFQERVSR